MTRLRRSATPVAALFIALTAVLAGCGSDAAGGGGGGGGADGGGGDLNGPCDVTDQATVASVFPGAGAGKAGQARNCAYTFAAGTVNIYLYDGDLAAFKKQAVSADVTFSPAQVGDAAIRDQLHTLTVQQGDTLFGVQALPSSGVEEAELAKYDTRTLALAKKIADGL